MNDDDRVRDDWACPQCSERRTDRLEWDDLGEHITCATCGRVYELPQESFQSVHNPEPII